MASLRRPGVIASSHHDLIAPVTWLAIEQAPAAAGHPVEANAGAAGQSVEANASAVGQPGDANA